MKPPYIGEEGEEQEMLHLNKVDKGLIIFICVLLLIFSSFFAFLFLPYYYNWIWGNKVLDAHIKEVVGNETDSDKTALLLMNWVHLNVHYPLPQENVTLFFYNDGSGIYKAKNRTIFFLRNGPASWTIKTKAGRCGEDARYFVEIMNKLGFKARIIMAEPKVWDHAWAEYYNDKGYKIIVDPSSNKIITNKKEWAAGKNVVYIQAIDLDGNKEDVTKDYLT